MNTNMRIALAQINPTVGDLKGNLKKISENIYRAGELGADIIAFPELAITGYPPEDLLLKSKFIADNLNCLKALVKTVNDIVTVVGFVDRKGSDIYNACAIIYKRKIIGIYHKMFLPNYGVFDEKRYFKPGTKPSVFKFGQSILGVNICEDIWYNAGPTRSEALYGAKLILNINASPYHVGKIKERQDIVKKQAKRNLVFIGYVNMVGGQDELVFDGQSMFVDNQGKVINLAEAFEEELLISDLEIPINRHRPNKQIAVITKKTVSKNKKSLFQKKIKTPEPIEEIYRALVLGLGDYVTKNGFHNVAIGLSGGVDSSLVLALAVDALGEENVFGVFMPSRYSSEESKIDAAQLADNLGVKLINIPIEQIFKTYLSNLKPHFLDKEQNITEENLQARIRGNILMALSNKFGWLVLTTGNKSEMSTGYATLYGDMAGGFAVIKDVPKTLVYKLSRYRNSVGLVIPERVLTKEPTAELKYNQKDRDTLPVYETLDPILKAYVEEDKDFNSIVALGFDKETVDKVMQMVDKSEYKRRQAPPGIKITPKAFGRDRRMPITNRYREY